MVLLRQLLLRKFVEHGHLLSQHFRLSETFRHQHVLANEKQVGLHHCHGAEKSFQVVWQLRTASIARVHRNVDTDRVDKLHFVIEENNLVLVSRKTVLHRLDLC